MVASIKSSVKTGQKLKSVMASKNITVRQLSLKTRMSTGLISNIRNGKHHYSWQLVRICKAINEPTWALLDENVEEHHIDLILIVLKLKNKKYLKALSNFLTEIN